MLLVFQDGMVGATAKALPWLTIVRLYDGERILTLYVRHSSSSSAYDESLEDFETSDPYNLHKSMSYGPLIVTASPELHTALRSAAHPYARWFDRSPPCSKNFGPHS